MNKKPKRLASLLLVFVMVLSLFPTSVFGASNSINGATLNADFQGEVREGGGEQTTTLVFSSDSPTTAFAGGLSLDDLSGLDVSIAAADDITGWYSQTNRFDMWARSDKTGKLASLDVTLPEDIQAGYYDVTAVINDWSAYDSTTYVATEKETLSVTATLTVLTSDGQLPDEPAEPTYGNIVAVAEPNKTADGVWAGDIDVPSKAENGTEVTVTLEPAIGYDATEVVVTDGAGEPVDATRDGLTDSWTFTMPDEGDVTVTGKFEVNNVGNKVEIGTEKNCDIDLNGVEYVRVGVSSKLAVYAKANDGYELDPNTVYVEVIRDGEPLTSIGKITTAGMGGSYDDEHGFGDPYTMYVFGLNGFAISDDDVLRVSGVIEDEQPPVTTGYSIAISAGDGTKGSPVFDKTTDIPAGTEVTFQTGAAAGYEIDDLKVVQTSGDNTGDQIKLTDNGDGTYTFTMPEGNVRVDASYKLTETPAGESYKISVDNSDKHGTVTMNGVTEAKAGETVTVYVKASTDYIVSAVNVSKETSGVVTAVKKGESTTMAGYIEYTFVMPESNVTVSATFTKDGSGTGTGSEPSDEVSDGYIRVDGTVTAGNVNGNPPLVGAEVKMYETGNDSTPVATTTTDEDGFFKLSDVPDSKSYTVRASYNVGVKDGKANASDGFVVWSNTVNVSAAPNLPDGQGTLSHQNLSIDLYYDWDVTGDGEDNNTNKTVPSEQYNSAADGYIPDVPYSNSSKGIERIYPGEDGKFLTADDFYQAFVGGKLVNVYAGMDGDHNFLDIDTGNDHTYYNYVVRPDGGVDKVFVHDGSKPGTDDDYYLVDVDKDPSTEKVEVYIDGDNTPATSDDYYIHDINGDGKPETVYAGPDGFIGTSDDWYYWPDADDPNKVVVSVGEDEIAGTADDWYKGDGDGHDEDETIFIGEDRLPKTEDDFYVRDVDSDGEDELIYAGPDAAFNTEDDFYETYIPAGDETGTLVEVNPGATGDDTDPYEFGRPNDHYTFEVGGKDVEVEVGEDTIAGTSDDVYPYVIKDDQNDGTVVDTTVTVNVGEDGIPGTNDDTYEFDADNDGQKELVHVGVDGIPGTADDWYEKDVNGDGENETVYAGEDGIFDTTDDWYPDVVGGKDVEVIAGEDGKIGTADDYYDWTFDNWEPEETLPVYVGEDRIPGTADDWYNDKVPAPGTEIGTDGKPVGDVTYVDVVVEIGEDGKPGTADDHYSLDADLDGEQEDVIVGADGKPGTNDDHYIKDVNGDGKPEDVEAGEDGIFATPDDNYDAIVNTPDGDQEKKPVYAGDDGKFSEPDDPDNDDWYPWDTNEDGKTDPSIYDGDDDHDKVFIDGDSLAGTDDDYYFEDVDGDGEDEKVFVGPDTIPGTEDDYYQEDVNGDGKDEDITAGDDKEFGTDDDFYPIPDQDGDGDEEKVFPGTDGDLGTPDDWYEADVDKDGEDEKVYVGDDKIPGTDDDWYYAKITFNAGSGLVNGKQTYSCLTSELTALPTASRSGSYSFVGWSLSANSSSVLTLDQVKALKTDTVLYAYYRYTGSTGGGGGGGGGGGVSSTYTVTFNSKGGSSVPSQRVDRNDTVDEPRDPSRDGYEFTGWYTNSSCTKLYDFDTKVTRSFTLYAGWDKADDDKDDDKDDVHEAVSGVLQLYPHISYISGYGNGKVGPNDNMTRAQAAQVFFRLLNADTRAKYYKTSNNFADCDPNAWYNEAVSTLSNLGIIAGYGNGNFGPNDTITRAQFATICARIGKLKMTGANSFTDVKSDAWYYSYVQAAADNNWVAGYGNGKFGPNDNITRAQVVTILNRVLERTPLSEDTFKGFKYNNWTDNQNPEAWYYLDMIEAGTGHTCDHDETTGVEIWTGVID